MKMPYLLLDAGGTLVFPDEDLMARVVSSAGGAAAPERLYEAHFRMVHRYDVHTRDTSSPPVVTIESFFRDLLMCAGAAGDVAERAVDTLLARHEDISLWTYTKPWVAETLALLQSQGIRMAVISNSDGRVHRQLEMCGITPYLEAVFDSQIVGVEKPDRRLFQHALDELGLAASDAVYVGDNYQVDIAGANGAGIGAIHLDPVGCYGDWPGVRIPDIRALPDLLGQLVADPARFDLFPAKAG